MQRHLIEELLREWTHNLLDETEKFSTFLEYHAINVNGVEVEKLQHLFTKIFIVFLQNRGVVVTNVEHDPEEQL